MANYKKSFNFRSGVQVDNDRLIVDARGNVGIGTSIPGRELDVYGSARVNGLLESASVNISGFSTFQNDVKIGSGITLGAASGIITAISFRGDGSLLSGVVAIATAGFISSGESLTTSRSIGIGTTNPVYQFQVGNTFGVDSTGNVYVSGVTTTQNLRVTGVSTIATLGVVGLTTTQNLQVTGVSTIATLGVVGLTTTQNLQVTGVSTIATLGVTGVTTTQNLQVTGVSTIATLGVTGVTTTQNLQVTGVSTIATLGVTGLTTTQNLQVTGVTTTQNLQVTGVSTIATLGVTGVTTTQNLQVTGVSTLGIVTSGNIYSSGIITANTFSGSLSGTASTAQSLTGTPNIDVGVTTTTILNASTSLIVSGTTLSALSNGYVGVGTTNPTADLQIKKSGATSLEVISTNNSSSISIGQSVGLGNSSASLQYESGLLRINNYNTGGFEFNLHEGTGTGSTDGFRVRYDSTNILDLTYDGKLGVNKTSPDYNLQVEGTAYISGNSRVVGILTIGTGGSKIVLDPIGGNSVIPFPSTQNFNTLSGISTFSKINASSSIRVGAAETSAVSGDITLASKVGIGTTVFTSLDPTNSYRLIVDGAARIKNNVVLSGQFALSSSGEFLNDPRSIPNVAPFSATVPYFSYGDFQLTTEGGSTFVGENFTIVPKTATTTVGFGTTNGGLVPSNYNGNKYLTRVGINTFIARSVLDVGSASTTSNSYFIPPSLSQTDLDIVANLWNTPANTGYDMAYRTTPNGVIPGAIVYNSTARQIQFAMGPTTFVGLATVGVAYAVAAGVATSVNGGIGTLTQLSVSGVTTSQNGFTSGVGITNPVKITVSGNILTFTVTGVGATSLTLF